MEGCPKASMINFDLKEPATLESSFEKPLSQYIQAFYHEDPTSYKNEIQQICNLRKNIGNIPHDIQGCKALRRYFTQLHYLQSRFPMYEDGEAAVQFVWYDVYNSDPVMCKDIRYEQACVLFNIGGLYSQLACRENRTTEESLRTALQHFRSAAGAYQYLKDNYLLSHYIDMTEEILSLEMKMMLGQAVECILEKSILDKKNPTSVAKIATQIATTFNDCVDLLAKSGTAEMGSDLRKSLTKHLKVKVLSYEAVSNLYMGNDADQQEKFGEKVTYLKAASDKINEALKLLKNQEDERINFIADVVQVQYEDAVKNNDFIYHMLVPDISTMEPVKGIDLAKPVPFPYDDKDVAGPDIFQRLVPMKAHEASSMYSEKKAQLLREISNEVEERDLALSQFLSAMKVEDLLDPKDDVLPAELQDKNKFLRDNPDVISKAERMVEEVTSLSSELDGILKYCKVVLDEEISLDAQENGGKEMKLLKELEKELSQCTTRHSDGQTVNIKLVQQLIEKKSMVQFLSREPQVILESLPPLHVIDNSVEEPLVQRLREILGKVEKMKTQRSSLLNQLRGELNKDDVTSAIVILKDVRQHEGFFNEQIKKHDKTVAYLKQNLAAQENIIQALTETNAKYALTREKEFANKTRFDKKVTEYLNDVKIFLAVQDKIRSSGLIFFKDLQKQLTVLHKRIVDFSNDRKKKRPNRINKAPTRPTAQKPKLMGTAHAPVPSSPIPHINPMTAINPQFSDPNLSQHIRQPVGPATHGPNLRMNMNPVGPMGQPFNRTPQQPLTRPMGPGYHQPVNFPNQSNQQPRPPGLRFTQGAEANNIPRQNSQHCPQGSTSVYQPNISRQQLNFPPNSPHGAPVFRPPINWPINHPTSSPSSQMSKPFERPITQMQRPPLEAINPSQQRPRFVQPNLTQIQSPIRMPVTPNTPINDEVPMSNPSLPHPLTPNMSGESQLSSPISPDLVYPRSNERDKNPFFHPQQQQPSQPPQLQQQPGRPRPLLPKQQPSHVHQYISQPLRPQQQSLQSPQQNMQPQHHQPPQPKQQLLRPQQQFIQSQQHNQLLQPQQQPLQRHQLHQQQPIRSQQQPPQPQQQPPQLQQHPLQPQQKPLQHQQQPLQHHQQPLLSQVDSFQSQQHQLQHQQQPLQSQQPSLQFQQTPLQPLHQPQQQLLSTRHESIQPQQQPLQVPQQLLQPFQQDHSQAQAQQALTSIQLSQQQPLQRDGSNLEFHQQPVFNQQRNSQHQQQSMYDQQQSLLAQQQPLQSRNHARPIEQHLLNGEKQLSQSQPLHLQHPLHQANSLNQQYLSRPNKQLSKSQQTSQQGLAMQTSSFHSIPYQQSLGSHANPKDSFPLPNSSAQSRHQPFPNLGNESINQPSIVLKSSANVSSHDSDSIIRPRFSEPFSSVQRTDYIEESKNAMFNPQLPQTNQFQEPLDSRQQPRRFSANGPLVPQPSQPTAPPMLSTPNIPYSQQISPTLVPQPFANVPVVSSLPATLLTGKPLMASSQHDPIISNILGKTQQSPSVPSIYQAEQMNQFNMQQFQLQQALMYQNQQQMFTAIMQSLQQQHKSEEEIKLHNLETEMASIKELIKSTAEQRSVKTVENDQTDLECLLKAFISKQSEQRATAALTVETSPTTQLNNHSTSPAPPNVDEEETLSPILPRSLETSFPSQRFDDADHIKASGDRKKAHDIADVNYVNQDKDPMKSETKTEITKHQDHQVSQINGKTPTKPISMIQRPVVSSTQPILPSSPDELILPRSCSNNVKDVFPSEETSSSQKKREHDDSEKDASAPASIESTSDAINLKDSFRFNPIDSPSMRKKLANYKSTSLRSTPRSSPTLSARSSARSSPILTANGQVVQLDDMDNKENRHSDVIDHRHLARQLGRLSFYVGEPDEDAWRKHIEELSVQVEKFSKYCKSLCKPQGDGFKQIWNDLAKQEQMDIKNFTATVGEKNASKNRYRDILPWDHSRVKLTSQANDYINATHIESLTPKSPPYIATQGPIPQTYEDFWTMVWEQKSTVIVMLTNEIEGHKLKCHPYWTREMDRLKVEVLDERQSAAWKIRSLKLNNVQENESRFIKHFQFTSWPDYGTPESPYELLSFMEEVHITYQTNDPSAIYPIILHCSAGVGRTGSFCCIYSAIKELEGQNGLIDIPGVIRKLRQCRQFMVQRREQMIFCFQAICSFAQQFIDTERQKLQENSRKLSLQSSGVFEEGVFNQVSTKKISLTVPFIEPITSGIDNHLNSVPVQTTQLAESIEEKKSINDLNTSINSTQPISEISSDIFQTNKTETDEETKENE